MLDDSYETAVKTISRLPTHAVNSAVSKFYLRAFATELCLLTNNIEAAEEELLALRSLGAQFIEPDMAHYIDLLDAKILHKRRNYARLRDELIAKLKRLLELGYCKHTYFLFFTLLLDTYVQLGDFTQVSELVDANIATTVQYNLELHYYTLKVYEMRVFVEIGNLAKAAEIQNDIRLAIAKIGSTTRSLFHYTAALLAIKQKAANLVNTKSQSTNNDICTAISCSISTMDIEGLKKLSFLAAVVADGGEQGVDAELWSKKYLQLDAVELFVRQSYGELKRDEDSHDSLLGFYREAHKVLKRIMSK